MAVCVGLAFKPALIHFNFKTTNFSNNCSNTSMRIRLTYITLRSTDAVTKPLYMYIINRFEDFLMELYNADKLL